MATPLDQFFAKVSTRRNPSGLVSSILEPERVYRLRLNRLSSSRILAYLGQEFLIDIHLLFGAQIEQDAMDNFFAPCDISNINDYPNNIPNKAIEKLPSFQGNNVINDQAHLRNFNLCVNKWCNTANFDDVKMRLFVLSLEEDALDWFAEQLANTFDTLKMIMTTFNEKFGDKKEERNLLNAINHIKKQENETVEEFNKRFNDIVKALPDDIKPQDKSLLIYYVDACNVDTSYEMRRKECNDLTDAQSEAIKMEQHRKAYKKLEIPGFNRVHTKSHESKGKEVKEVDYDPIKELTQ